MSHRDTLRDLAYDSHGVVTLRQAKLAGVPAVEVRKLAARGALTRLGQGVYRLGEIPAGRLDEFAVAIALVGGDAELADESVLAAIGIGQINMRRIRIAVSGRVRRTLPETIEVVPRSVSDEPQDYVDGIPAANLVRALQASRKRIMPERLVMAVRQAEARGLLSAKEAKKLVRELQSA